MGFFVAIITNLWHELYGGDLGAEPGPDGAELEADDAGADDDHLLGHRLERQGARRRDDLLLVDLDARERRHLGARGDQDVLGAYHLLLGNDSAHEMLRSSHILP